MPQRPVLLSTPEFNLRRFICRVILPMMSFRDDTNLCAIGLELPHRFSSLRICVGHCPGSGNPYLPLLSPDSTSEGCSKPTHFGSRLVVTSREPRPTILDSPFARSGGSLIFALPPPLVPNPLDLDDTINILAHAFPLWSCPFKTSL